MQGPDYAEFLEDFLPSIDNIPLELQHVMNELLAKDTEYSTINDEIQVKNNELLKLVKTGPDVPYQKPTNDTFEEIGKLVVKDIPEQSSLYDSIHQNYQQLQEIMTEKTNLSIRVRDMVDRHLRRLAQESEKLDDVHTQQDPFASLESIRPRTSSETSQKRKTPVRVAQPNKRIFRKSNLGLSENADEQVYCYCQEISYGEMIACDSQVFKAKC